MPAPDLRESIQFALAAIAENPLLVASSAFFSTLGYRSDRTLPIHTTAEFIDQLDPNGRLTDKDRDCLVPLRALHLLFQLSDADFVTHTDMFVDATTVEATCIESYLFFAVELPPGYYTRTALSAVVRAINKPLPMPALVFMRHGESVSLGIIHRRLSKRDAARDVLEKVTLIKDINLADPIRAHVEILHDFSLTKLDEDFPFDSKKPFVSLHEAWQKRLGAYALSNTFYREIADWYFWAKHQVDDKIIRLPLHCDTEQERSLFLIRLLTRVIFSWFLVEKRLIPTDLFREHRLKSLLKDFNPSNDAGKPDTSPSYYRAVLQNLFFGTLNMPPESRSFRERKKQGERYDQNHGVTNLWRYETAFHNPTDWTALAARVPFLNGGLFDCLDDKSGKKRDNFILDGFSDREDHGCHLPNDLFFCRERTVDLSRDYGEEGKRTARSKKAKVRGLIEILSHYKFTIEENTPIEEEIALDPELLGKVFENLLASYIEDTRITARKALGAFYTPREIVSYMVDEALKSYLATQVPRCKGALEDLFSNKATLKEIKPDTRQSLISAIGRVKILDPACGSGAFPMGALHRLVDLLQKLDPNNETWKRDRLNEARRYRQLLEESDATLEEISACDTRIDDIEKSFDTRFHALDFARKLYLIENSIYGVDIQPIATQIAKLRFFISLVVDQKVETNAYNLGVRPLPNLETRLVAANTLIPIEKSENDLLTGELDKLRAELSGIRHEHFNARSPAAKRKWREDDEAKRGEIAELLERNHAIPRDSARKLADWDPYDQNAFAPFFDSEWMFSLPIGKVRIQGKAPATLLGNLAFINEAGGQSELTASTQKEIDSGFDIVIGNPPYGVKFPSELKRQLGALYPQAARVPDSYAFFILGGISLLRPGGVLGYIVPNTFCDLENGDEFRRHLLTSIKIQTIWQSGWVFNAAVVDTLVVILEASEPTPHHEVLVVKDGGRDRRKQAEFLRTPLAKIDFRSNDAVLELKDKVRQRTKPLSSQFYVKAGVKMYEVGKGTPPQSKGVVDTKPFSRTEDCPNGWRVLYRGGDIAPFHVADSGERVKYGPWLAAPRSPELFEAPKILMRRTDDRLRSCLDLSDAICVNSCHVIKLHTADKDSRARYYATLAILNSKVCQWIFEADNPQMIGKTFAEIKVVYVERLPLPEIDATQLDLLQPLVEILMFLNAAVKRRVQQTARDPLMLAYWERVLNGLVYELYFPEELHDADLRIFELVAQAQLSDLLTLQELQQMPSLRTLFETLYDGAHPLRIAVDKLQTLDTVRVIEGKS